MDIDIQMAEQALAYFKCDGNSAVHLKMVQSEKDVFDEKRAFHPEMSHQIFGESETIFGFSGLKVQLYYHTGSLLTYLGMKYKEVVSNSLAEGIEPDPVLSLIAEKLSPGFLNNLDDFIARLPGESSFKPMGEKLRSYEHNETEYEIFAADILVPKLRDYHARLQTFLLWFIDAASFIDVDDDRWHFYFIFEKKKSAGEIEYNIVGYMTVYHYYAYPDKIRPRISQMLIIPPYQRQGHGAQLLETVNEHYIKDPQVLDLTVEDPSESFVQLRDYVDAVACTKLAAFSPEKLKQGFSEDMVKEAQDQRKINKLQCRKVYEILRLQASNVNNFSEYKEYRLDVKRRLNIPFQKEKSDMEKLKCVLKPEELSAAMALHSPQERIQQLEQMYQELEALYNKTIKRMAAYS